MEAIHHPVTYEMIGDVEKAESGDCWFANVIDGEQDYNSVAGACFKTKRSAIAWVKRKFKELYPTYNKPQFN